MASTRDRQKAVALSLAVAMVLSIMGTVQAQDPQATELLTTGHTAFIDASTTFNPCFAGIAGGLMQRVTWFNGATLFTRMSSGGSNTWIYAMETFGGPGHDKDEDNVDDHHGVSKFNPSNEKLIETGNVYRFHDQNENPNAHEDGTWWEVHEFYVLKNTEPSWNVGGSPGNPVGNTGVEGGAEKVYVYAVKVLDHAILDMSIGKEYNFAMVVNTCKFLHNGDDVEHTDGENCGGANQDLPECQHDPDDVPAGGSNPPPHEHDQFDVDIFVGGQPDSIKLPANTENNDDPSEPDSEGGGAS